MTVRLIFTDTHVIHRLYGRFAGTLAFDVGACGGLTANIFAESFDHVIALEPSEEAWVHLSQTCADNVFAMPVAASDHLGRVDLTRRAMSEDTAYLFTGDSLPEWGEEIATVNVPAVTLDSLAEHVGYPDFVKIDTEGHECLVLDGAHEVFDRDPKFLIEIHSEANGEYIRERVAECSLVRHNGLRPRSYNWRNHYWLVNQ